MENLLVLDCSCHRQKVFRPQFVEFLEHLLRLELIYKPAVILDRPDPGRPLDNFSERDLLQDVKKGPADLPFDLIFSALG